MNMKNDIIQSSIYGFIVGDAMGVPIEFTQRNLKNNQLKEMIGYGSHNVPEGTWSDDTSMTLATLDSIQENRGIDYEDMMKKFVNWYFEADYTATDTVFDIGNATARALLKYARSSLKAIDCGGITERDNGNGSLMRMLPVSLYLNSLDYSDDKSVEIISDCSALTHAHDISKLGCVIYNRYLYELMSGKNKFQAYYAMCNFDYQRYFSQDVIYKYERILSKKIHEINIDDIRSSGYVVSTLEAVIWSILTTNNYEEAIVKSINLGNDTDTIGAITGSIAGLIYGYNSIPKRWLEKIKKRELIDTLIEKYKKNLNIENKPLYHI